MVKHIIMLALCLIFYIIGNIDSVTAGREGQNREYIIIIFFLLHFKANPMTNHLLLFTENLKTDNYNFEFIKLVLF